ncbi:MAG: prepilin-type N-terminal cleavage/methylation domain-containing protein [Holdemania massiliensis]
MKRGFTLLEMIIVVSVLAILFLLSVPNIQQVMKIVDEKGCAAQLKRSIRQSCGTSWTLVSCR